MSILKFNKVNFTDGEKTILKDINFEIKKGDYVTIVGPSGSGKSTLLKLCNNLISPSDGSIYYNDKNITEYNPVDLRKDISYCLQIPHLFGETVMDNLSFPFKIRNAKINMDKIHELTYKFKIRKNILDEKIINLSGGEKQRISLMRTLMHTPDVLLLDEVTSSLDVENTSIVEDIVKDLNDKGVTILWITHDMEQSFKYANKRINLNSGELKELEVIK
ncbi:ABC transporter ATP-binding protein [Clostridium peptidivorans]|uniref:ABC transporter ATP-binding protein n=1 Tax=Clostridium peptidivorans TaxID=100174 RepID=UPI000BE3C738|nr:ATP-binding cassette domain-containing protein [Clostridium peptidivorans]